MIKKSSWLIVLASFLIMALLLCGTVLVTAGVNKSSVSREELREWYYKGETLVPPEIEISYGNEKKNGVSTLIFPSGKAQKADSYYLDEEGEYTLRYTAEFSSVPVEENFTFQVVQHLYEFSGSKSKGYYGVHEDVPDRKGIVIELAKGEEFIFNRPIDLNGKTKKDSLIKLFQIPSQIGVADANQIIFKLTDTEDPTNYLTITAQAASNANAPWSWNNIYVRAGAPFQPQSGWEGKKLHSGDKWGCSTPFSLYGICYGTNTYKTQTFSLQFDYENKRLHTGDAATEVVKFDDPAVFEEFWSGFEKGTANLSISCGMYNKNYMTLVLTDIAGFDLANADVVKVADGNAPVIEVEHGDIPQAVVNNPYSVFPVKVADDQDDSPEITCKVFYGYGSSSALEYDVVDGAFVPDRAGEYIIEYRARDYFGNVAIKTVAVTAGERSNPLTIELKGEAVEGVAGKEVALRDYTVSGAIGSYDVSIKAELKDSDIVYEVKDNKFIPEYEGTYKITYTLKDYITAVTADYELKVVKGTEVSVRALPEIPDYLIVGCMYNFTAAKGTDYSSGKPVDIPLNILTSDKNAQVVNGFYIPGTAGKTTLTFVADNGASKAEMTAEVEVVNVGYGENLNIANYFYGDGVTYNADLNSLTAVVKKDASFEFINELDANFSAVLNVDDVRNFFGAFEVRVCDSADESQAFVIKFLKNKSGENVAVQINGVAAGSINASWFGDGSDFSISFNNKTCKLNINAFSTVCKTTATGELFTGFSSGRVRVAFSLMGVTGESGLKIMRLNNQTFKSGVNDIGRPQITVLGDLVRNYKPGDVAAVVPAIATDVLDPNVDFSVSVLDPEGEAVVALNGVVLSEVNPAVAYEFKVEKQGNYSITWVAKDTSGREEKVVYTIGVVDNEDPVISFESSALRVGKTGKKLSLPNVKVTDDFSQNIKLHVYVTQPDGVMKTVSYENGEKNSFVPDMAGKWKVTFYAADEAGNTAVLSYFVDVE